MCGLQSRDSDGRNMLMNKGGAKHLVAADEQEFHAGGKEWRKKNLNSEDL